MLLSHLKARYLHGFWWLAVNCRQLVTSIFCHQSWKQLSRYG